MKLFGSVSTTVRDFERFFAGLVALFTPQAGDRQRWRAVGRREVDSGFAGKKGDRYDKANNSHHRLRAVFDTTACSRTSGVGYGDLCFRRRQNGQL